MNSRSLVRVVTSLSCRNNPMPKRKPSKAYKQGVRAWNAGKKVTRDNPYKHGTIEWQGWVNGWCDRSEDGFLELVKHGIINLEGS